MKPWIAIAAAFVTAAALVSSAAGQADARQVGPLVRLFPHWQDYLDLPADERSHFTLAYVIASTRGVPAEDINIWYESGGNETGLALDSTGQVLNPPDLDTLASDPVAWINQPQGGMSVSLSFQANLEMESEIARLDTLLALEQANRAMRSVGGVASLFAPSFKTLIFVFEGPAPDAWAVTADGRRTPLIVQESQAIYRPNDRDLREVDHLVFGRPPARILIES
ncbi:hypothetical protein [Maricaulis salignorans]|uniref:Uncharacterized protein n=1 Tax=Maricaulis salignorans TaxID=144026 RepID=A0A1G9QLZ9_9PROT|nr:hypothetical protein [Maricaulis salignorans]SDM12033.1 hypothetical protein SAMN04488568_10582 [Maricaulis salignorans]